MNSTLCISELRKRVEIGGLELRELTILKHRCGHLMLIGEFRENILRSRNNLALAILHRLRKEHLVEEDIAQLFRRVDVETMPGVSPHCGASLGIDTLGEVVYFDGEAIGHLTEHRGIDTDTNLLHPQKDRDERLVRSEERRVGKEGRA